VQLVVSDQWPVVSRSADAEPLLLLATTY